MKLRLIVQSGPLTGYQYELSEGWLLLGRGEDCAIRFNAPQDACVSSRHALIHAQPDGFYLIDQRSTNGTLVNRSRVEQVKLRSGDLIQLGPTGPQLQVFIEPRQSFQASGQQTAPSTAARATGLLQVADHLSLYNPVHDTGDVRKSWGIGCASLVGAMLALMVIGLTVAELGLLGGIIAAVVAFVPAAFYLMIFLWLDRYDPEPVWLLSLAFAWGALVATFISFIFNTLFGAVAGDTLTSVVSAPFIEEGTKGLGVLLIALLFRKEFDSIVDGIVYAGVVALGFATVENVIYYGRGLLSGGMTALMVMFFLRGVLSPFSHVLFTSMTGIGCGIARETHHPLLRVSMPVAGYVGAIFLHGLWNLAASLGNLMFFALYFLILMPMFWVFLGIAIYLVRREGRILKQMLAVEVSRGLITPEQLELICSVPRRTQWLVAAFGHQELLKARRRFLRAASKLGLCHWHVTRATSAQTQTQSFPLIPRLQAEVFSLRDQIG
jgi:RsiW-degrading membrane proteinase PrsW (M82 family)